MLLIFFLQFFRAFFCRCSHSLRRHLPMFIFFSSFFRCCSSSPLFHLAFILYLSRLWLSLTLARTPRSISFCSFALKLKIYIYMRADFYNVRGLWEATDFLDIRSYFIFLEIKSALCMFVETLRARMSYMRCEWSTDGKEEAKGDWIKFSSDHFMRHDNLLIFACNQNGNE